MDPVLVGDVFYTKLFSDHPRVEHLFHISKEEQARKLVDMLTLIVGRLDRLDGITEDIRQLGRRHMGYGVKPHHYAAVGDALMWTLQQGLGTEWNRELEAAWRSCFNLLAQTMLQAAAEKTEQ